MLFSKQEVVSDSEMTQGDQVSQGDNGLVKIDTVSPINEIMTALMINCSS